MLHEMDAWMLKYMPVAEASSADEAGVKEVTQQLTGAKL